MHLRTKIPLTHKITTVNKKTTTKNVDLIFIVVIIIFLRRNYKPANLEDILTEQFIHFSQGVGNWFLDFFTELVNVYKIPKIWRKAKIIALLKPGKDPDDPIKCRPISFLCQFYKQFKRIILNRLCFAVDNKFINKQPCFRPKKSCLGLILNLTHLIETGYKNKKIISLGFIDFTAANDIVNRNLFSEKFDKLTGDYRLVTIVETKDYSAIDDFL